MELTMSAKELDRLSILRSVEAGYITRVKAAEQLSLSTRQISRLLVKMKVQGPVGLISPKRGKQSNRALSEDLKNQVLALIDKDYYDYGPTLISEKLFEHHEIMVGKETIRRWLIASNRRQSKRIKPVKIRQLRARRDCFGELIQIDGSAHDWFEGRRGKCTLLVFIDDATSRVLTLKFVEMESTHNYFSALEEYLREHGKPRAIYTDKHNVFKVNVPGGDNTDGLTQFGRALKHLGIQAIFAHSPEAKGRVERANCTLQDRLIKELRYHQISTLEEANQFIKEHYLKEYNHKFAVSPKNTFDLHQKLSPRETVKLKETLSIQTTRKINKQLIIKHHNTSFMITNVGKGYRLQGKKVTMHELHDGSITIIHNGKKLDYKVYAHAQYKPSFADRKTIDATIDNYRFLLNARISARGQQYNS